MQYADAMGVNSTQTHGCRQDCSTYDIMIISQLSNDITVLNHSNLLIMFNDADGCYNHMPPELRTIAIQRLGCPRLVAYYHSCTSTHMVHIILTFHGISSSTIYNSLSLQLGGACQGSAGSGVSWHCHMEPLLQALTLFSPGFQFNDTTNRIQFIQ